MPDMVLNRTRILSSTLGHVISFKKDVSSRVPPTIVPEALAMGAVFVNSGDESPGVDDDDVAADKAQRDALVNNPARRKEAIVKAFKILASRNERGSFDAAGRPHPKAISKLAEFKVDAKERDKRWQEYVDEMANPDDSD